MKILLVIDKFGSGGAQTQMALLYKGLISRGHDVKIFTYYESDFLESHAYIDFRDIRVNSKNRFFLGLNVVLSLAKMMSREKYDSSISFLNGPSLYSLLAALISRFKGVVIVGERNVFRDGRPGLKDYIYRSMYFRADSVVSNSKVQMRLLLKHMYFVKQKLKYIPNCVDMNKFSPASGNSFPSMRQDKIKNILCVARIVPEKNAKNLIYSLKNIVEYGINNIKFTWAGKVHDQAYKNECISLLDELGLESYWVWMDEEKNISKLYLGADIFILASFYEGMPNVVCEALASGVPCAVSDIDQTKWLINGGKNGRIFDPNSPKSISQCLIEMLSLPSDRVREMKFSARKFALENFSEDAMVDSYLKIINDRDR